MSTVTQKYLNLQELLADLDLVSDRLEFFVDQAKHAESLAPHYRSESFRVRGCISNLWIVPSYANGCCQFLCDGDAVIPKGVACTILELFQHATPAEILSFDSAHLKQLGIAEILSPNRRNALSHVFDVVYRFALSIAEAERPQVATA